VRIGWCDIDAGLREVKDMITERIVRADQGELIKAASKGRAR